MKQHLLKVTLAELAPATEELITGVVPPLSKEIYQK
jgi:hypothetical protein